MFLAFFRIRKQFDKDLFRPFGVSHWRCQSSQAKKPSA
jgi:hypothetical protein